MEVDSTIRRQKLDQFVKDNKDAFTEWELMRIRDYIKRDAHDLFVPDLMREIYDELGLLTEEQDIYTGFMSLLGDAFPYRERKILEVGGGIFPRLGKRISKEQTTGSITVYDPRLCVREQDTPKMKLIRKKFHQNDSIGDHNLMIAFMACEGAEQLLDAACKNKCDFMVGFCEGGPHGDGYDFYEDEEEWLHCMMYIAESGVRDHRMGKVKEKELKQYGDPYPVIYNER